MDELSAWKMAASRIATERDDWKASALQCGLYRADSDVSTPDKWTSAQSSAACTILAECDALKADNDRLRAALEEVASRALLVMCADPAHTQATYIHNAATSALNL